jgi:hypothetical protein
MSEVIPADPAYRLRIVILVLALAVVGAGVIVWLERTWAAIDPGTVDPEAVKRVLTIAPVLLGLPLLIFGLWLARFSLRVRREERFPPEGVKVIRDTQLVTGDAARLRARIGLVLALLFSTLGVFVPLFFWVAIRAVAGDG